MYTSQIALLPCKSFVQMILLTFSLCFHFSLLAADLDLDGTSGATVYLKTLDTSSNNLNISLGFYAEYLVVAGGGGGGGSISLNNTPSGGGGGGGGGMLIGSMKVTTSSYSVIVGAGGAGGQIGNTQGQSGGNSSFGSIVAFGGGGNGLPGGSGGGGSLSGSIPGGFGQAGQGNNGGASRIFTGFGNAAGGGGGGAGAAGGSGSHWNPNYSWGGEGGAGAVSDITGSNIFYAGGGGGGAMDWYVPLIIGGPGGLGGGGSGSTYGWGGNGVDGLGGGGGGAGSGGPGGRGGNGIIVVRYANGPASHGSIVSVTGGNVSEGNGTATGYKVNTFTSTSGTQSIDFSNIDMNGLGAVQTGVISGYGNLNFVGPGILTLNATNTYTGTTNVISGSLAIGSNGSISTSSSVNISTDATFDVSNAIGFTIVGSQTLTGSGMIKGNIAISGNHSPGYNTGIQSFANNLIYNSGATVNWELISNDSVTPGTNYDQILLTDTANLSFSGATMLNLSFSETGSTVVWNDNFWNSNQSWMIWGLSSGITTNFENLAINTQNWLDSTNTAFNNVRPNSTFYLSIVGQNVVLNYVPEPSTWVLGSIVAAIIGYVAYSTFALLIRNLIRIRHPMTIGFVS